MKELIGNEAAIVLTESLRLNPKQVIVIGLTAKDEIWATWSSMSLESLVYLKDVFTLAVAGKIRDSVNGMEESHTTPKKQSKSKIKAVNN